MTIDNQTLSRLPEFNPYSAKFLKIHYEMEWVDLTVTVT